MQGGQRRKHVAQYLSITWTSRLEDSLVTIHLGQCNCKQIADERIGMYRIFDEDVTAIRRKRGGTRSEAIDIAMCDSSCEITLRSLAASIVRTERPALDVRGIGNVPLTFVPSVGIGNIDQIDVGCATSANKTYSFRCKLGPLGGLNHGVQRPR